MTVDPGCCELRERKGCIAGLHLTGRILAPRDCGQDLLGAVSRFRHFNKLRGPNHFKDVPCMFVVGRPKEAEQDTEDKAEAGAVGDPQVVAIKRQAHQSKEAARADRRGKRSSR